MKKIGLAGDVSLANVQTAENVRVQLRFWVSGSPYSKGKWIRSRETSSTYQNLEMKCPEIFELEKCCKSYAYVIVRKCYFWRYGLRIWSAPIRLAPREWSRTSWSFTLSTFTIIFSLVGDLLSTVESTFFTFHSVSLGVRQITKLSQFSNCSNKQLKILDCHLGCAQIKVQRTPKWLGSCVHIH